MHAAVLAKLPEASYLGLNEIYGCCQLATSGYNQQYRFQHCWNILNLFLLHTSYNIPYVFHVYFCTSCVLCVLYNAYFFLPMRHTRHLIRDSKELSSAHINISTFCESNNIKMVQFIFWFRIRIFRLLGLSYKIIFYFFCQKYSTV